MIVTTSKAGKTQYRGISDDKIRALEPDQLVAELERVEAGMRRWHAATAGQPKWVRQAENMRRERNVLKSEKERIERELDARAARYVETEKALDREVAQEAVEA